MVCVCVCVCVCVFEERMDVKIHHISSILRYRGFYSHFSNSEIEMLLTFNIAFHSLIGAIFISLVVYKVIIKLKLSYNCWRIDDYNWWNVVVMKNFLPMYAQTPSRSLLFQGHLKISERKFHSPELLHLRSKALVFVMDAMVICPGHPSRTEALDTFLVNSFRMKRTAFLRLNPHPGPRLHPMASWCGDIKFYLFFLKIFLCEPFLKSLLNLLQYCFCFMFWFFWPWDMWDLSSLTRDQTHTPCIRRQSLNHWTAREVPCGHTKV